MGCLEYYESSGLLEKMYQLYNGPFKKLVFSGMGSSHFCAIGAGIYLKQHGVDNQVISTGELLYYEKDFLDNNTLLILISQSGESAEMVHLLQELPEDIMVIAVTNDTASTLARRGNLVLPLHVMEEEAVTTRTYMASVCITLLLASAIAEGRTGSMLEKIKKSVSYMEKALDGKHRWKEIWAEDIRWEAFRQAPYFSGKL